MKVTVLVENNSRIDRYLLSEPALSFLIELNDKKILFDAGYSDAFIKNAKSLGMSLTDITDIVLSHGHNDHTRGLKFLELRNVPLVAHPKIFDDKVCVDKVHKGCALAENELVKRYDLILTIEPYWLTNELVFLGAIPNNVTPNVDDSALVYKKNQGIWIITGCSHSGIVNIVNYAKKVTNEDKILGILGGCHLLNKTKEEMRLISEQLMQEGVPTDLPIYPCHCCDLFSKIELSKYFNVQEVCTGDILYL